jgi:hypothetical protein
VEEEEGRGFPSLVHFLLFLSFLSMEVEVSGGGGGGEWRWR